MLRRRGERGFRVVTWDEALDRIAGGAARRRSRRASPSTSRRAASPTRSTTRRRRRRASSAPTTSTTPRASATRRRPSAMKATLGYGASTCSYADWLHADLIVLFGSNVANNQPVTTKYLHYAKKNGAQIAVVNPYREPGLARYWVPSIAIERAVRHRARRPLVRRAHRRRPRVPGRRAARARRAAAASTRRSSASGPPASTAARDRALDGGLGGARARERRDARADARRSRGCSIERPNAVFVWSMGLTQHAHGVDTIKALVNVGLARGLPGRPNRGLVPIRGHSGVQGGAEVGCVPAVDAGDGGALGRRVGVPGAVDAGMDGGRDGRSLRRAATSMCSGSSAAISSKRCRTPTPAGARSRGRGCASIRTSCLSSSMLVDGDGDVLLLPAATRYESPGGGTETSTERRIIFSPEIPGPPHRIGAAGVVGVRRGDGARASRAGGSRSGSRAPRRFARKSRARCRSIEGIETLNAKGDQVQWGGPHAVRRRPLRDARRQGALRRWSRRLTAEHARTQRKTLGGFASSAFNVFRVSTRRGKQFNSMVQREVDPLTGARRDDVLISEDDIARAAPQRRRRGGAAVGERHVPRPAESRADQAGQPRSPLAGGQRAAVRVAASIPIRWNPTTTRS